jgi:hypothetical protein
MAINELFTYLSTGQLQHIFSLQYPSIGVVCLPLTFALSVQMSLFFSLYRIDPLMQVHGAGTWLSTKGME